MQSSNLRALLPTAALAGVLLLSACTAPAPPSRQGPVRVARRN